MPKAGQYHGHAWTHRSEFQKTEGFAKINIDECVVTGVKTFGADSDDELSESNRASKRRRIERLAGGYLKGDSLVIPSARPCPQALNSILVWNKKSYSDPNFRVPDIAASPEPAQLWKDVEDDDETLSRLVRLRRSDTAGRVTAPLFDKLDDGRAVENVTAQATCRPQRRLRQPLISSGPSEEALQKAAALHNRKERIAVTDTAAVLEEPCDGAPPGSDPADCINVTQSGRVLRSRGDKLGWLSRRKSRTSFGGAEIPERPTTAPSPCVAPSSVVPPSPADPVAASPIKGTQCIPRELDGSASITQDNRTRVETEGNVPLVEPLVASEAGHEATEQRVALPHRLSQDTVALSAPLNGAPVELGTQSAPATGAAAAMKQTRVDYMPAPSTQNGSTPLMYRKRATRSKAQDHPQNATTAPTTRRSNRRRITFPSSEDVQAREATRQEPQQVASHPPILDMPFEPDYSFAPKLNMALVEEHTNRLLPSGAVSEGQVMSIKKALRRELRNSGAEMTRCDSEPPTSSQADEAVQPALLEQAEKAGPGSMRLHDTAETSHTERRQTWLGTQAMVARAEKELFTSPEKHRSAFTPINEQTPVTRHGRNAEHTPASQERGPLKQLSQEPVPSTQAMLKTFGGFSTVKKPRVASMQQHAPEDTPVAAANGKQSESRRPLSGERAPLSEKGMVEQPKEMKRSSLRFSMSSLNSPAAKTYNQTEVHGTLGADHSMTTTSLMTREPPSSGKAGRKSTLKSSAARQSGDQHAECRLLTDRDGRLSQSMSISMDLPSPSAFQAAQRPEEPLGLLRDTSNMSQTIDDLAKDVLGTTRDLDGVMGQ